jgi:IMP dehydrogenase
LKKKQAFPLATIDKSGKLLVGAAVKANGSEDLDVARVRALQAAGCNIIILDAQNGDNLQQVNLIKLIKKDFPGMDVIAGNIVRVSQARTLLDAGADGLRIGMGVGSVATTQLVKAVGRAQLSSIYACALVAKQYGVPVIADGGICNTGCLIKALAIGAQCVMMGSLLAGVDESPGDYFFQDGMRLKHYRGNFSHKPVKASSPPVRPSGVPKSGEVAPEFRLASGVSGAVVDKGPLSQYFPYLCQSVRHGLQDMGVKSLVETWEQLYRGELRFEVRSPSAQKEGGVHDLHSFQQRLYA